MTTMYKNKITVLVTDREKTQLDNMMEISSEKHRITVNLGVIIRAAIRIAMTHEKELETEIEYQAYHMKMHLRTTREKRRGEIFY